MTENTGSGKDLKSMIKDLDPESYRMKLIQSARQFKSNWVSLGEFLTKVATEKLYQEWGYRTFEEYCRVEIKVKKNTAMKLTNAYFFVTQEEPDMFQRDSGPDVPELDAVCVLQRAKEDNTCTPEHYQTLKEAAMEKGQSGATLNRKYKQLVTPEEEINGEEQKISQSLSLIRRLTKKMEELEGVPENLQTNLSELEEYLQERQLQNIEENSENDEQSEDTIQPEDKTQPEENEQL